MSTPTAMTNDDFNLDKFIKLMGMTTADSGEAVNAIRMANAMLRKAGWTWEQLLRNKITIVNDPFGSIPTPPKPQAAPPPRPAPPPPPPRPAPPPPPPPQGLPRDKIFVEQCFDTLDFADLSPHETAKFQQIRAEWNTKRNWKMLDVDFNWLRSNASYYKSRSKPGRKPKRVF